jgi:hypothetical protein
LVFGYPLLLGILYQIFHPRFETLETLLIPINFPYMVYVKIFGYYQGDRLVLKAVTMTADVLIYSVLFYPILTVFSMLRAKHKIEASGTPPPPPVFD